MSVPSVPVSATEKAPAATSDLRLHGHWILLGRGIWVALQAVGLIVLVASLPLALNQFQTACTGQSCASLQLTPEQAQTLQTTLGLSLRAYAMFALGLNAASALFWMVGMGLFLWRKLDQVSALLMALQGITQGLSGLTDVLLAQAHSSWQVLAGMLTTGNAVLLFFVFALFPNGRFAPRWMRWLGVVWVAFNVLSFSSLTNFLLPPYLPLFFLFLVSTMLAQGYRYVRYSTPVQRQQTKWVIFSVSLILVVQIGTEVPLLLVAPLGQPGSLYGPIINLIGILVLLLGPTSLIIAIRRYRLWDIDTIINKALVYGSLTGLLGAFYAGLIIGLESLAGLFGGTGAQNPVVLVISTLVIAALFQPVRKRLQAIIDKRFYRQKYDAEKTLAAFSATLRQEVDLEQVRAQLLAVVQETMQPMHVSLWLRQPERYPGDLAHRLEPHGQRRPPRQAWAERLIN